LLGLSLADGCALAIEPHWPSSWPHGRVWFSPPGTRASFSISFRHAGGGNPVLSRATLDGEAISVENGRVRIEFPEDAATHEG
jgi:hypothetical protein